MFFELLESITPIARSLPVVGDRDNVNGLVFYKIHDAIWESSDTVVSYVLIVHGPAERCIEDFLYCRLNGTSKTLSDPRIT